MEFKVFIENYLKKSSLRSYYKYSAILNQIIFNLNTKKFFEFKKELFYIFNPFNLIQFLFVRFTKDYFSLRMANKWKKLKG